MNTKINCITFLFTVLVIDSQAQIKELVFDVMHNNNNIGTLHATEEKTGNQFVRNLKTNTDAKIMVLAVHVESEVTDTHEDGALVSSTAYRHSNRGSNDVHSRVTRTSLKNYQLERNGQVSKLKNTDITFCIVNLYFREPVGLNHVFSTMFATFLPIKVLAPGRYEVVNPENRSTIYIYKEGHLTRIEMDTPVGSVYSIRR